jgi:ketosteroid isomerase-like protein
VTSEEADAVPEESVRVERVRRHWEWIARDVDRAHEMYHEDAVLEFPQSGERFEGVENFREWRRRYPADLRFRVRRITASGDLVVVECSVSYGGGPWQLGVQLLDFRGDRVARERIYVTAGWDAPEWRAPWRAETPADPPE